jgi:DUF2934 family protein
MPRRTRKLFAAKAAPKTASNPSVPHDEIAREAFKIYQARHGAPGDPVADWFEATRIVTSRTTPRAPKVASAQAAAGNSRTGDRARTAARRRSRK